MTVGRREMMLGTLGMGVALAAGPRPAKAVDVDIPQPFSTYGIVPGGGIDQTASLQDAADQAARSGTPFFLPPGNYTTYKLELKSGTQIQGVPGKSVLRYTGGGRLISIENAAGIRLTGLTLAGEARQRHHIADCAFSAIRSNSGSNCQMVANSCARLGEVALYAEFSFEGAVIANKREQ